MANNTVRLYFTIYYDLYFAWFLNSRDAFHIAMLSGMSSEVFA